jgi:hypothetical protein
MAVGYECARGDIQGMKMKAARDVDHNLRELLRDAFWKFIFVIWLLMIVANIIMVSIAVSVERDSLSSLRDAAIRLDAAFEFDFAAFATTPCRTCDGADLIVHSGTPIVVSPFLNTNQRQFPQGIQIPCFTSYPNRNFEIEVDATVTSASGLTVDANTLLKNPQGMRTLEVVVDCMGAAPCIPALSFCTAEFGDDFPSGPIYHYIRTNVGSGMDTLEHICICILDWDPVSEETVTLPYCTEPLATQ